MLDAGLLDCLDLPADLVGRADQVRLDVGIGVDAPGHGLLERSPEQVERRALEPLTRLVGRLSEARDGLESCADLRWISPGLPGVLAHDAPAPADALGPDLGGQPSLAQPSGAPHRSVDVARPSRSAAATAGFGNDSTSNGSPILPVIRRAPLVEEDAQCFEALGHQVC